MFLQEKCLRSGQLFTDPKFDYNLESLGEKIDWARPQDICSEPKLVVEGTDQFDVIQVNQQMLMMINIGVQGRLGDCWLLAAMSSLAIQPELLSQVLVPGQSLSPSLGYSGAFLFRFWLYGAWLEVVVDDFLPCISGRLAFIHSDSDSEFWSPLLEKAYAKLHGSYTALRGGSTSEAMVDFTGGISETISLQGVSDPGGLFRMLEKAQTKRSLNCCSIQPDPERHEAQTGLGLIKGHAYSITKVARVNLESGVQEELVRVRNPWVGQTAITEWRKSYKHWENQFN